MNLRQMAVSTSIALAAIFAGAAHANTVYTEDFEATFPTWKLGWFGANSNATNYYCQSNGLCNDRGNNPDGLWIATTTGTTNVVFSGGFGDTLSEFSLDVAGYSPTTLTAYDRDDNLIFSQSVTLTFGAFTDPGTYSRYTITSANGISRFDFSGAALGNTSIDNLRAVQGAVNGVPEPTTALLVVAGLAAAGLVRRRRA